MLTIVFVAVLLSNAATAALVISKIVLRRRAPKQVGAIEHQLGWFALVTGLIGWVILTAMLLS